MLRHVWVLTLPRSGSNWLMQLMDKHSNVNAYGEIFLNEPISDADPGGPQELAYERFIETWDGRSLRFFAVRNYLRTLESETNGKNWLAYKMMSSQLSNYPEALFFAMVRRCRVIYLRRNSLDAAISRSYAYATNRFHTQAPPGKVRKVSIDPDTLIKDVQYREKAHNRIAVFLKLYPFPSITIDYEELQGDTKGSMKKIFELLEEKFEPEIVGSNSSKKIIPTSWDQAIENAEEIRIALRMHGIIEN